MRRVVRFDPNVVLAVAAAAVVLLEAGYRTWTSDVWLVLQLALAAAALAHAWREQERLQARAVVAVGAALALALVGVHALLDVVGDKDSSLVYRWQGNALVRGDYPRSEYPAGAVLLFGLEAWTGDGTTRWANALLMVPFAAALVAAVAALRTPWATWLAAVVALWPANAFYWQYKFDLAPAALLALGALLAWRGRWSWAGAALGLGAVVKWTPGLAAVVLVAWLLARRETRAALAHAAGFVAVAALVYVPLLVWSPSEVLAAYERQSGRAITPESVWYLLLRPLDLAHVGRHISFTAGAPDWANVGATALQVLLLIVLVVAATRVVARANAVALAALAPVVFLLTNRIFSPQFVLVAFAGWAVAAALVVRSRREQLAAGATMAAAAAGNMFVYPFALPWYDLTWPLCSLLLFAAGLGLSACLAVRAVRRQTVAAT